MKGGIPDKLFFRIGEVAELAGVKPHVLRYWESEIGTIRPTKSKTNQRLYRRKDVEQILRLRELLYDRGYTLAGAKRALREPPSEEAPVSAPASNEPDDGQFMLPLERPVDRRLLREIRDDLLRLRRLLQDDSND